MSEGQKWTCDCGYGWLQADNCPICGGSRAEVNAKLQGFGSSRCSAEDQAETTDAERSGDRGVQPAAEYGNIANEIAEAICDLKWAEEVVSKMGLTNTQSRMAAAIERLAEVAKLISAANTK